MSGDRLDVVVLGLSITSSWGNGHATNYRALLQELSRRGHRVLFLERDVPWYAAQRDLPDPSFCETRLYGELDELYARFGPRVRQADVVVVGSYVPDGVEAGSWVQREARGVVAFYDIDTPVTLAKLEAGDCEYLTPGLIGSYDLYLSFTGGYVLHLLEERYGSPAPRAFYCLVDPDAYRPEDVGERWSLGYMGTYSPDRQPGLEELLLEPARRRRAESFVVAGPSYPGGVTWPDNVERIEHLPPAEHRRFYNSQRFTLNVTRLEMVRRGWSPSVRLFEAAACGVPVISDVWPGIERFFVPEREILLVRSAGDVEAALEHVGPDEARRIGAAARRRVLAEHTPHVRADQFEAYVAAALERRARARATAAGYGGSKGDTIGTNAAHVPAARTA